MDRDAYDVVFEKEGPMGIDIESSEDGLDAYIRSSTNPAIKPGHLLVAVNDEPLEGLQFEEILTKVKLSKHPRKLSFSSKKRPGDANDNMDLPLPADFFSKLPPLTKQEEDAVKKFMDDNLKEALRLVTATPESLGLSLMQEKDGVSIHASKAEGQGINLVRAQTKVNIASDLFMMAALAGDNSEFTRIFTMLDPMFRDGQVVQRIPATWTKYGGKPAKAENINLPLYSIKWAAYALPFPLWWRDFVFCELTCWTEQGYGVSLAMSFPLAEAKVPNLEASHKLVRGSIGMSGYLWRNVAGTDPTAPDSMQSEITYLLQVDPKGVLPAWAVNLTGTQQGMNCLRVVGYAEEQRKLVLKMYGENPETNRIEVLKLQVNKGEAVELQVDSPEANKTLVIDWLLEDNDLTFVVLDAQGKEVHRADKAGQGGKPYFARVPLAKAGKYTVKFDNSYSWFTGKTVYYHYAVV